MPTLYGVCVWGNRVETINNAENERCVMAIINQGANLGSGGLGQVMGGDIQRVSCLHLSQW